LSGTKSREMRRKRFQVRGPRLEVYPPLAVFEPKEKESF